MSRTIAKITIAFILIIAAVFQIRAEESEVNARLLVSKQILNRYLVEKSDILVRYTIYNVGNVAANTVKLEDTGFQSEVFDIAGGQPTLSIDRIPPQANYTHVLVVRPKSYGYFNFTAAEVTYKPHDEAESVRIHSYIYISIFYFIIFWCILKSSGSEILKYRPLLVYAQLRIHIVKHIFFVSCTSFVL